MECVCVGGGEAALAHYLLHVNFSSHACMPLYHPPSLAIIAILAHVQLVVKLILACCCVWLYVSFKLLLYCKTAHSHLLLGSLTAFFHTKHGHHAWRSPTKNWRVLSLERGQTWYCDMYI